MAKRDYTPYQKNIIRNYYEHKDTIIVERLQTALSDLYLAASEAKRETLWARVFTQLEQAGLHPADIEALRRTRDLAVLAGMIQKLY